jgi:hypothetical protein
VSRVAIGTWAIGGWMWGGTDEAVPRDFIQMLAATHNLHLYLMEPRCSACFTRICAIVTSLLLSSGRI